MGGEDGSASTHLCTHYYYCCHYCCCCCFEAAAAAQVRVWVREWVGVKERQCERVLARSLLPLLSLLLLLPQGGSSNSSPSPGLEVGRGG